MAASIMINISGCALAISHVAIGYKHVSVAKGK
jgi:hypothetical protein